MRIHFKTVLLLTLFLSMIFVGCGESEGPAEPVAGQSEVERFLAENPEADVDEEEPEDEMDEEDEE